MPDRSLAARARLPLARIHHRIQLTTYPISGLLIVLAVLSPDFRHAAAHVISVLTSIILN